MTDVSSLLALPYLKPAQAQKHVTHNEALRLLDVLVQLTVTGFGTTTPPALPVTGEIHAIGPGATGDWDGHDNELAARIDEAWIFMVPQQGWRAYGHDDGTLRVWDGSDWAPAFSEFSESDLQNVSGVGINTSSDSTNRLALEAPATLLSHDGDDHRLKINKAATGDTASLLFQSNWSGRAEIGPIGGDDFLFKVSPDGSSWTSALALTTGGNVGVGTTSPGSRLESVASSAFSAAFTAKSNGDANNWAAISLENVNSGGFLLYMDQAGDAHIRNNHAGGDLKFLSGAAEVMRVTDTGHLGIGTSTPSTRLGVENSGFVAEFKNSNASATEQALRVLCSRTGSNAYSFITAYSDCDGSVDLEFHVRGDGTVSADGSFIGSGADYAEYFEWQDGNPDNQDRRGLSVVLEQEKIRLAQDGETPIGVISGNPSVVGDGDMDRWKGKYLRDTYNSYLWESYQVTSWTDEDGLSHSHASDQIPDTITVPDTAVTHQVDSAGMPLMRRQLNPDFDPSHVYTPRAERPEWAMVGLMGKLRLRQGQPVGPRWIGMRPIADGIEEWLVR